jgi:hypothetical protein
MKQISNPLDGLRAILLIERMELAFVELYPAQKLTKYVRGR